MPATLPARSDTGSYQLPTSTRTLLRIPVRATLYIAHPAASSLASIAVTWGSCGAGLLMAPLALSACLSTRPAIDDAHSSCQSVPEARTTGGRQRKTSVCASSPCSRAGLRDGGSATTAVDEHIQCQRGVSTCADGARMDATPRASAPLPVPRSSQCPLARSGLSRTAAAARSTSCSVSGRGMRVPGPTASTRSRQCALAVRYCSGSRSCSRRRHSSCGVRQAARCKHHQQHVLPCVPVLGLTPAVHHSSVADDPEIRSHSAVPIK